MADPDSLRQSILATLRSIPHVVVFDGEVPTEPPADTAGRVLPYVVLWASAGVPSNDAASLTGQPPSTLSWEIAITCAGGTPARAVQAAVLVRSSIERASISGSSPISEISSPRPVSIDTNTNPHRFFTPMLFRLLAP